MQDLSPVAPPPIPAPSPAVMAMFHNTNRNSLPFLQAAGIDQGSKEHKELMKTMQALYRQYLHPFKYLEEQAPDRVDQLIARARLNLPWLDRYEDGWPARVYLKRYVDTKRPHLRETRYARLKQINIYKSKAPDKCPHLARNLEREDPNAMPEEHNFTLRDFLCSLKPSLEHHLDAFAGIGIKDQETLRAFLSWPQATQAQFLDDNLGILQLTSLERQALLVGCGLLAQMALQKSLVNIINQEPLVHE